MKRARGDNVNSDVSTKATFKDVAYLLIDNDGTIYILEENNPCAN
ncbi:hypothetical protein [Bacteroides thetaiotaomicron]|nr:hypothetical protein [Bacteroides thetaiotaomicron]MCS2487299.1 hypothetical protein [Bacteroides thetaiotaomicron]